MILYDRRSSQQNLLGFSVSFILLTAVPIIGRVLFAVDYFFGCEWQRCRSRVFRVPPRMLWIRIRPLLRPINRRLYKLNHFRLLLDFLIPPSHSRFKLKTLQVNIPPCLL
ncbi:hypothetical protein ASPFODRAFT_649048 [Aspergillus luchuensis CBS 106.47]|uniref:Uncharacterized protein n=1 Tax=Aspergillus luchuensis (strain CBS 106.47) TaxID=1137211 RepID=A0A1M3TDW4_ASPLC|nr:hypothetical protein ASPFODRAFT_649048 [Aspergillus luchuensis CBS 106.47]